MTVSVLLWTECQATSSTSQALPKRYRSQRWALFFCLSLKQYFIFYLVCVFPYQTTSINQCTRRALMNQSLSGQSKASVFWFGMSHSRKQTTAAKKKAPLAGLLVENSMYPVSSINLSCSRYFAIMIVLGTYARMHSSMALLPHSKLSWPPRWKEPREDSHDLGENRAWQAREDNLWVSQFLTFSILLASIYMCTSVLQSTSYFYMSAATAVNC